MASAPAYVTYAGWVYKEGSLVKSWKKRFLVVKRTELAYYKTADHQSRNAQLMGSMRIARVERAPTITNGLLVHGHDARVLRLMFDSAGELDKCLQAIQQWSNVSGANNSSTNAPAPAPAAAKIARVGGWQGQQYTGWLYKQGAQFPVWNRRYFVLDGSVLTYSVGPATEALGRNRVLGVRRDASKQFTLAIMLESGRELRVTGSSEVDISEWQRALRQALQRNANANAANSVSPARTAVRSPYRSQPGQPPSPVRSSLTQRPVQTAQDTSRPSLPAALPEDSSWNELFSSPDDDNSPRELMHLTSFGDRIEIESNADGNRNPSFLEFAPSPSQPLSKPFSPKAPGRGTILEMRVQQHLISDEEAETVRKSLTQVTASDVTEDSVLADPVVSIEEKGTRPPGPCCCVVM